MRRDKYVATEVTGVADQVDLTAAGGGVGDRRR